MGNDNNNGWICLHRSFKDWQHYGEPSVMVVFIDLLLHANHKEGWWHGHKCERGATFRSIRSMSEDTTLSSHTIIRALRILESTGEIKRVKIDQKHTKTIVRKYAQYQDFNKISVAESATQTATQTATQSATKQQYNNNNNIVDVENVRTSEKIVEEFMQNEITIEQFCMSNHITKENCRRLANEVVNEWVLTGKVNEHRNITDERTHLISQIRIKIEAERKAKSNQSKADKRKAWEDDLMAGALQTLNEIYKN